MRAKNISSQYITPSAYKEGEIKMVSGFVSTMKPIENQ